ncbi:hypothetical protein Nizo2806_2659 [Lactiplantibacillus plantarum]|nr:hypothetical protein HMPREF0531_10208 [Lactiplantibacillus plantarum subsp. plantarum ATCC 14917 = JCM 1149 = CGMCC 1.2437]KFL89451.1 hypothetical protein LpDm1_1520 [Lactiplantibacillus plantarum]KPN86549.1 hypothetical protein Nizo2877_0407 [Lactiplantibacillus plantarum]KZE00241.1 hypothetical protein FBR6_1512 [Lactiplantibacillus plantarum]KZU16733.1 hypothetical protein CNW10_1463 [Lactiplantibacillus plantarum]
MRPNFPQLVQWQQEHRPHPNVADHSALVQFTQQFEENQSFSATN